MSKLYEHTTALYRSLDAAATTEIVNDREARVFRGSIVRAFRGLGISQGYYSEVRKGLVETESITIIRRGSRNSPSVIVLHREPDKKTLEAIESSELTNDSEVAILLQELRDVKRLIGSISIPDALMNIEQRLQAIERQLNTNNNSKGDHTK